MFATVKHVCCSLNTELHTHYILSCQFICHPKDTKSTPHKEMPIVHSIIFILLVTENITIILKFQNKTPFPYTEAGI